MLPQSTSKHPHPQVQQTCLVCGSLFLSRIHRVLKGYAKFCSIACRTAGTQKPLEQRFWEMVNKNGPPHPYNPYLGLCWLWIGSIDAYGYGRIPLNGKYLKSHRYSWELANGEVPSMLGILHSCDVRLCVNPHHLYPGTPAQNVQDAVDRSRMRQGESISWSKLTETDVLEIRRRYTAGEASQGQLSREYGIAQSAISKIIHRKTWKHI